MSKITYNQRTLAACAKRLRYLQSTDGHLPQGIVVWRYTEGFRLQLDGEQHEPDGCRCFNASNIDSIENALTDNQADDKAQIALSALLEVAPEEFTDQALRYLSLCDGTPSSIQQKAFLALCSRNMEKHPDEKRRSIA